MIQNNQWSIDTMNILSGSGVSCVDSILIYKARLCMCPSIPLLSQMCYFCSILLIILCYVILWYFCFVKRRWNMILPRLEGAYRAHWKASINNNIINAGCVCLCLERCSPQFSLPTQILPHSPPHSHTERQSSPGPHHINIINSGVSQWWIPRQWLNNNQMGCRPSRFKNHF